MAWQDTLRLRSESQEAEVPDQHTDPACILVDSTAKCQFEPDWEAYCSLWAAVNATWSCLPPYGMNSSGLMMTIFHGEDFQEFFSEDQVKTSNLQAVRLAEARMAGCVSRREAILESNLESESLEDSPDFASYVKDLVQEKTGFPRFRLTLLLDGGKSWEELGHPREIQAVRNQAATDMADELMMAIYQKDAERARGVLEQRQDPNCQDADGHPAIMVAAAVGSRDILEMLLQAGADSTAVDELLETALHAAAEAGQLECAEVLLENGETLQLVNQPQEAGLTPLHMASRNGHVEMIRLLLDFGACRDARDHMGVNALHVAAEYGQEEVVEFLLEIGMDIEATEEAGATALYLAAENGQLSVVKALVEAGAEKNAADEAGATALYTACQYGHADVIAALLAHREDACR
eukprot:g19319.t2